jgi:hypothetical protein
MIAATNPVDRLLRPRACAPDASVPTVKAHHLFPLTKEKNPERFRKNEKMLETADYTDVTDDFLKTGRARHSGARRIQFATGTGVPRSIGTRPT